MEIEFQNDYTVIPCVYTTPAFYMDNIGPPCAGAWCIFGLCTYMVRSFR